MYRRPLLRLGRGIQSCTLYCSRVVGWVFVVVVMGVVDRVVCLSLLLMKSLSTASHFELSAAVVSQVVPLLVDGVQSANFVVFGNHPCLLPIKPALSEDPPRDSIHCQLVVSFVRCSYHVVSSLLDRRWCCSLRRGCFLGAR